MIEVRGLELYAYHGVPDAEQAIGHRYVLDALLSLFDCPAIETDHVMDSVNYAEVCRVLAETMTAHQDRTLERLAARLADAVLDAFPRVAGIELRVAKRLPPAPFIVETLGVTLRKLRS